MPTQRSCADTWVIVEVRGQKFAVQAVYVREILRMPETTAVPLGRPQDRGVINLRGRVLPLIDLRTQFGWQSVPGQMAEFQGLMDQRREDHRNWLRELDNSATEGTEFRLATDPHKCAFGKWYYSYRSDSPWIMSLLRKFEPPHNAIHGIASTVTELVKAGKKERAQRLIGKKRNEELRDMILLFQALKDLVRETARELAMVIALPRRTFAIAIDQAVAVETIAPGSIKDLDTELLSLGTGGVRRVAQRSDAKSNALILEPEMFVPSLASRA